MPNTIKIVDGAPVLIADARQLIEQDQVTQFQDTKEVLWPLQHWQEQHKLGKILSAVWLSSDQSVDGVSDLSKKRAWPELIVLRFLIHTDGRGFSQASTLRSRGYSGEIRALGAFLLDQIYYMRRCGFDSFSPDFEVNEEALDYFKTFSLAYQSATDDMQPVSRRRV